MRCSRCQTENRDGRRFCASCGVALAQACKCGYVNDAADRFCGGCGRPLEREVKAAVDRPVEADGDRRPVAIMFCDLVGYTRLSSKLDPEEVRALLEQFFGVIDAVVERFGGTIDKHIGDAAMALFGAPRAHGDDALRAVRAAVEIQTLIPIKLRLASGPPAVHVALAMGDVMASRVGSERRSEYTVIGEAANLAARLLGLTGAGEILASEEIREATARLVDYEALGGQILKGFDDPVPVFRLKGLRESAAESRPLIGRRAELAQCRNALMEIADGQAGAVIVVRGEPGIGKTRFVEELQAIGAELGFARHLGWALDFGVERGRGALGALVRSLLDLPRDASPAKVEEALAAAADREAAASDDALYLRDLIEAPLPDEARRLYEAIDTAARARGKELALARLIDGASDRRPLLLIVEDVHWADAETLGLLAALARATAQCRAALVLTTRIDGDPLDAGWRATAVGGFQLTIDLAPLTLTEAETIARTFATAEDFAARCVERADGNPLFLEQLLRAAGDLGDGKLPTTVQSVVLARADLLAPNDRRAIEAASALGQRFSLATLRAVIDDPCYDAEVLLRNALLKRSPDGLQFVHALVRDGVYASLTRARRRQLHGAAARALADEPTLRAEHLDLATDPEAARAYLAASKDQEALFRQDQAIALARRGLAIASDLQARVDLALQVGDLELHAGRGQQALEAYRGALSDCHSEGDRVRALIGAAAANRLLGKLDDAFAALSEAEARAPADAADRALAEIHYLRGNLHFARGELDSCRNEHAAALEAALRFDSQEWRAHALSGLADAQYMDCRMATALELFSECVELNEAAGLTRIVAPNRLMMGHCRIYLCAFDAGVDEIRRGLEIARRIGDRHGEMIAFSSIGFCLAAAGRYEEAANIQVQALEQARALKARRYEAAILGVSAELALAQDDRREALALVREGMTASEETSPGFAGPILYGLLALIEKERSAREAALAAGEALLTKGAVGHNQFWFRRFAIEAALQLEEWDEADAHADALAARTAAEPLPYSDLIVERGRILARIGRGTAGDEDVGKLAALRAKAAAVDFRIDALRRAPRTG
ncbi:MAG TPA: adenylate/guanylate cyclase domain-containing protein [Roseiarcus sp.]|nr:adenylate/guanylate cyclase domain-containing protein [Roseiarcus sp.]